MLPLYDCIGYYLCLFMQTKFQLGSCIHAYINEICIFNICNDIPQLSIIRDPVHSGKSTLLKAALEKLMEQRSKGLVHLTYT